MELGACGVTHSPETSPLLHVTHTSGCLCCFFFLFSFFSSKPTLFLTVLGPPCPDSFSFRTSYIPMSISQACGSQTPNSNERDTCHSQREPRGRTPRRPLRIVTPHVLGPERRPRCGIQPVPEPAGGPARPPPSDLRAPRRSRSRAQGRRQYCAGWGVVGRDPDSHPTRIAICRCW